MRRWLFLFWFALLLVPAAGLLGPWERSSVRESRMLGQPPGVPHTTETLFSLPRETDAFVRDQFGWRDLMIRINGHLRERLNDAATTRVSPVVTGNNGYLLLREGLAQSVGAELSPGSARTTAALVCEIQRRVEARGAQFLYALPPSPGEIYPEIVPDWIGAPSGRTDYDLIMEAARACGAHTLDLRPVLRAERRAHQLFRRTDTHWTDRGALIAYDAVADALARPDLRLGDQVRWREVGKFGDLMRMLDGVGDTRELTEIPDLRALTNLEPTERALPTPVDYQDQYTFIRDYGREGPSVLVIGDSFTRAFFGNYLATSARRVGFMHHRRCRFDWRDLEQVEADIVLLMPAERSALCEGGARPLNFD